MRARSPTGATQPDVIAGGELEFHSVQLATVWAERAESKRWSLAEGVAPPELDFAPPLVRSIVSLADGRGFRCDLSVSVTVPVGDREAFEAAVVLRGFFASDDAISIRHARIFSRNQAVFLLWPFARAYLDVLATLAGVAAPPLPTLVIPRGR